MTLVEMEKTARVKGLKEIRVQLLVCEADIKAHTCNKQLEVLIRRLKELSGMEIQI